MVTKENFYHDKNSVYVRLTYHKEDRSYEVVMLNEMNPMEMDDDAVKVFMMGRGLVEFVRRVPAEICNIGFRISEQDLENEEDDTVGNPVGTA